MYEAGVRVFVEVGPRGSLSAFVSDTLGKQPHVAIPLDLPRRNGIEQLCRAIGMMVAAGVPVHLAELYRKRAPRLIDLTAEMPKLPGARARADSGHARAQGGTDVGHKMA